mgnify:CR=1 FL=1
MPQPRVRHGSVLATPQNYEFNSLEYVISLEPFASLQALGKVILSRMKYGTAKFPWQVQYGRKYIDCANILSVTEDQALRLEIIDTVSANILDELADAHAYADHYRTVNPDGLSI